MQWLIDAFEAVRNFMELGGDVLTLIAITIFAMWILIADWASFRALPSARSRLMN